MMEKRSDASGGATDARNKIIELLRGRPGKAFFAAEVFASLRRWNLDPQEVERVLAQLEAEGKVMIRDNYCADPHLAGVDLRIVARVDGVEDADPQSRAVREIDNAWNEWLTHYLENHRCG